MRIFLIKKLKYNPTYKKEFLMIYKEQNLDY
jgi:hypothetical protein